MSNYENLDCNEIQEYRKSNVNLYLRLATIHADEGCVKCANFLEKIYAQYPYVEFNDTFYACRIPKKTQDCTTATLSDCNNAYSLYYCGRFCESKYNNDEFYHGYRAIEYYERAAELGHGPALFGSGRVYIYPSISGRLVGKTLCGTKKGIEYYIAAARKDFPLRHAALRELGYIYGPNNHRDHSFVELDCTKAISFLKTAIKLLGENNWSETLRSIYQSASGFENHRKNKKHSLFGMNNSINSFSNFHQQIAAYLPLRNYHQTLEFYSSLVSHKIRVKRLFLQHIIQNIKSEITII